MARPVQKKPFKTKGLNLVTYAGEAEWCKYLEKQLDTGQYSPRGKYSVNLLADPEAEDYKLFVNKVEALIDKAYDEAIAGEGTLKLTASKRKTLNKVLPFKEHILKDKDENGDYTIETETGKMYITPKLNNVLDRERGKDYVKLIGKGNVEVPRSQCPEIGNGSIIKCKVYANPYYMPTTNTIGVSFIWVAIKIIELKEYHSEDGEDFDADEGITPIGTPSSTEEDFDDNEGDF